MHNCLNGKFIMDIDGFKYCSECGSLNPIELAELIKTKSVKIYEPHLKSGYPYKFFVKIYNENDSTYFFKKLYTKHFLLIDLITLEEILPIINSVSQYKFYIKNEKLKYCKK